MMMSALFCTNSLSDRVAWH